MAWAHMLQKASGTAALALVVVVALLSVSLHRANDELDVLRSRSEEMHRQSEEMHRRLAALEGAQPPGPLDRGAAAPRGRALQDGDCVSAGGAAELAVKTSFTVKEDLLVLSASVDALAAELASTPAVEAAPCSCRKCANDAADTSLCRTWSKCTI